MKILTISDLLCLTLNEILEIRRVLRAQVNDLPYGSIERYEAVETLANIELVLVRPDFQVVAGSPPPSLG